MHYLIGYVMTNPVIFIVDCLLLVLFVMVSISVIRLKYEVDKLHTSVLDLAKFYNVETPES